MARSPQALATVTLQGPNWSSVCGFIHFLFDPCSLTLDWHYGVRFGTLASGRSCDFDSRLRFSGASTAGYHISVQNLSFFSEFTGIMHERKLSFLNL